jgi:pimeloyl-ACP methyl ester carboxylesterase
MRSLMGAAAAAILCIGCTRGLPQPDLGTLYSQAAKSRHDMRNPVIVIPGILGSRLVDQRSERIVWGAFSGKYANPNTPDGARLLALPMRTGERHIQITDDVQPNGVLDRARVSLLGLPLELNAYLHILATLGVGGYRDEPLGRAGVVDYGEDHFTCFQFDYDWRHDNAANARRLHDFIVEKRAYVETQLRHRLGVESPEVKFDIVAHSMGGLVTRYFLRYGNQDLPADGSLPEANWAGAQYVDRAILVGTPNGGSANALIELVHGVRFAPTLPKFHAAILGTMPSIYQLLPRTRHGTVRYDNDPDQPVKDLYDVELWKRNSWGLADPAQDRILRWLMPHIPTAEQRRSHALRTLTANLDQARRFNAALDVPATPPSGLSLYLFAGDAESTADIVGIDQNNGRVWVTGHGPGDGTVTRTSALADERQGQAWSPGLRSPIKWHQVFFLFTDHLGITRDPVFADNVLFILMEQNH